MSKKVQANRPENIDIKLTKKQIEQLKPLFDYSDKQYNKGVPGVIFSQPKQYKVIGPQVYSVMTCGFIPQPFANKIVRVAKRVAMNE